MDIWIMVNVTLIFALYDIRVSGTDHGGIWAQTMLLLHCTSTVHTVNLDKTHHITHSKKRGAPVLMCTFSVRFRILLGCKSQP